MRLSSVVPEFATSKTEPAAASAPAFATKKKGKAVDLGTQTDTWAGASTPRALGAPIATGLEPAAAGPARPNELTQRRLEATSEKAPPETKKKWLASCRAYVAKKKAGAKAYFTLAHDQPVTLTDHYKGRDLFKNM